MAALLEEFSDLRQAGCLLDQRHPVSAISLSREYGRQDADNNSIDAVDSILAHACRLCNVPALVINSKGKVLVDSCDTPIEIDKDVYLTTKNTLGGGGDVQKTDISLYSNKLSASELLNHVNELIERHRKDRSNAIGNKICYFEQKVVRSRLDIRPVPGMSERDKKRQAVNAATPRLTFSMSEFHSNKKFSNLYGEQIEEIERRVKFFVNNKDWYDARGIPYQLGMLYSNMSGCGKSSAIRAIANYTRRHIINVNFSKVLTLEQLNHMFFNEEVDVEDGKGNVQSLNIPIDRRLYVIEELDAAGDVVYQRSEENGRPRNPIDGELTLADILLVLDGNRESPGRMVIMTANHPELLDDALIRPGRMDVVVSFTNASKRLMRELYTGFFSEAPHETIGECENGELVQLTAAEVSQVYFRHLPVPEAAAVNFDLQETARKKVAATELSRKAMEAHREKEKRAAEEHSGLSRVEDVQAETFGLKPESESWTVKEPPRNMRRHTAEFPEALAKFMN